ncbi:MAG: DUF503 domain-containing protein [Polyangiaceae bacterium]|nr:DUF503 domain-containing protein [Polyangiaceae bacterium]
MFVGVARFVLQIPGARSLKDRRRVVRSLKERLRARLPVSVAEVGEVERYQVATLGVAVVSNASACCREVLDAARGMAGTAADAILADAASEVIPFGTRGAGVRGGLGDPAETIEDWDESEDDHYGKGRESVF